MGTMGPPVIVRPMGTMVREDPHRLVDAYSIFVGDRQTGHNMMRRDAVRLANLLAAERHSQVIVERPHGRVQSSYADTKPAGLRPVARRMLLYLASKHGGEWPRTKGVETRTMEELSRGGYVKFIHPHGVEITAKGLAEIEHA